MVDDARGHDRDIVDKPQKSVDEGIYPAYPRALLHYGGGKEASRDEHLKDLVTDALSHVK